MSTTNNKDLGKPIFLARQEWYPSFGESSVLLLLPSRPSSRARKSLSSLSQIEGSSLSLPHNVCHVAVSWGLDWQ